MLISPPPGVGRKMFTEVVAAAQMAYMFSNKGVSEKQDKVLPDITEVAKFCQYTETSVAKIVGTDEFVSAMEERGIFWDARKGLTPEQIYAIGIMTDPSSRKDFAGKLRTAGITMQTYRAWLKQPIFARAIKQVGEDMLGDHVADVQTAILSKAVNGDMKAIEIYHQLTGKFDPQRKQIDDLQRMVGLLLETIFRYVQDTTTLEYINRDFEKIMHGKVPEATLIVDGKVVEENRTITPSAPRVITELPKNPLPESDESIPDGFFEYSDKDFDF